MITKHKNRYILIEASDPIDTQDGSVSMGIINSTQRQIGELGHIEMHPKIIMQYNERAFIMRVNRGSERKAMLALAFIKEINGKRIGLYTIKTSGTIHSLTEYCKKTY